MPRTAFQKAVFGAMMALVMVYGMEVYNASLRNGGLSHACFVIPAYEMVLLCVAVIMLERVVGGPLARGLAFKLVSPKKHKPLFVILAVSISTVCFMCPLMSLVAVVVFKGLDGNLVSKWIQTFAFNFPMALGWQLLIAGPLVRMLFRRLFAAQIASASMG